jgi:putative peptide maturation dehydrogenase
MSRVRRTHYAFLYVEDSRLLDVAALFAGGEAVRSGDPQLLALAVLTGERHRLSRADLDLLLSVPADRWIAADARHTALARKGLLISDDPELAELRERDEALSANEWNLYAALFHHMTRWSGVDIRGGVEELELDAESRAAAREFVKRHGPPPGPFHAPRGGAVLDLPDGARTGELFRTLAARRTTRAFALDAAMTLEDLSTVLHYVFGCHGYATTVADVVSIKRTSPSGGGLHPIEAYPIVRDVRGVAPGIYHYDPRGHSLTLVSELERAEARRTATAFMCGQSYFGAAHVSFVLTARFYRNHWKYRRHQKAYAGILMDAAHLSQTLYLVSAELGLGAFVTLAVNARDIEARLGIDGVAEGVVAMIGCGRRAPGESPLELSYERTPIAGTTTHLHS